MGTFLILLALLAYAGTIDSISAKLEVANAKKKRRAANAKRRKQKNVSM